MAALCCCCVLCALCVLLAVAAAVDGAGRGSWAELNVSDAEASPGRSPPHTAPLPARSPASTQPFAAALAASSVSAELLTRCVRLCRRWQHAAVVYGDVMYVFGGVRAGEYLQDMWTLTPNSHTHTRATHAAPQQAVHDARATAGPHSLASPSMSSTALCTGAASPVCQEPAVCRPLSALHSSSPLIPSLPSVRPRCWLRLCRPYGLCCCPRRRWCRPRAWAWRLPCRRCWACGSSTADGAGRRWRRPRAARRPHSPHSTSATCGASHSTTRSGRPSHSPATQQSSPPLVSNQQPHGVASADEAASSPTLPCAGLSSAAVLNGRAAMSDYMLFLYESAQGTPQRSSRPLTSATAHTRASHASAPTHCCARAAATTTTNTTTSSGASTPVSHSAHAAAEQHHQQLQQQQHCPRSTAPRLQQTPSPADLASPARSPLCAAAFGCSLPRAGSGYWTQHHIASTVTAVSTPLARRRHWHTRTLPAQRLTDCTCARWLCPTRSCRLPELRTAWPSSLPTPPSSCSRQQSPHLAHSR